MKITVQDADGQEIRGVEYTPDFMATQMLDSETDHYAYVGGGAAGVHGFAAERLEPGQKLVIESSPPPEGWTPTPPPPPPGTPTIQQGPPA